MFIEFFGEQVTEVLLCERVGQPDHRGVLVVLAEAELRDHKVRIGDPELDRDVDVDAGPDHAKEFSATVAFSGEVWGEGSGRTKKEAEQAAAAAALERLTDEGNPGT